MANATNEPFWTPPFGTPQNYYYPPALTPQQQEEKRLRRDGNIVGGILLAVTAGTQFTFTVLVFLLMALGVLQPDQLSSELLGFSKMQYMLLYAGVYAFAMAVPAVIVALCCKQRYFPLSPCHRVVASDVFFGVLGALGVCMVANLVASFVTAFLQRFGFTVPEMPDLLEHNLPSLALYITVFAVLPALLEEMVLRGYVLRILRPYGDWFAVTVSAVMFGLMHGNIEQIPFALVVGFALGWLYVATENIWLPVAVHFCNNALSCLMEYFSQDMTEISAGVFSVVIVFSVMMVGGISLAFLAARRSDLFRRLPVRTTLTGGRRLGMLLRAPAFVIAVIVMLILTLLGAVSG